MRCSSRGASRRTRTKAGQRAALSARIDADTLAHLDELAEEMERSRARHRRPRRPGPKGRRHCGQQSKYRQHMLLGTRERQELLDVSAK